MRVLPSHQFMSKRVGEEYNRVSLTPLVLSLKKVENTA